MKLRKYLDERVLERKWGPKEGDIVRVDTVDKSKAHLLGDTVKVVKIKKTNKGTIYHLQPSHDPKGPITKVYALDISFKKK